MMGLIALHLAMFRKYGVTHNAPQDAKSQNFWPDQVLKDGVACLAVLVTVCVLSAVMRAELGAPADPAQAYNAARPEWYYLFLFQLLKVVDHVAPGEAGIVLGAHIIPALVFGLIALMPIIGRWKLGHRFNIIFLCILMLGIVGLTAGAWRDDYNGETAASQDFLAAKQLAHAEGLRAREIATRGIPPEGMLKLVRDDTKIAGYRLFKQHCAVCHGHYDRESTSLPGVDGLRDIRPAEVVAANLHNFGSRDWVAGLLHPEQIANDQYFGKTIHAEGDMAEWVKDNIRDAEDQQAIAKRVQAVSAALSASAALPYQSQADVDDAEIITAGAADMVNEFSCIDCHKIGDEGDLGSAPDLTGYASREWLIEFIKNPQSERFYDPSNYDETDRLMPAFEGKLSQQEIETLADWLRTDWYKPPVEAKEAKSEEASGDDPPNNADAMNDEA